MEDIYNEGMLQHYDLVPAKRAAAVRLGAIEHDWRQMAEFMQRKRPEAPAQ